MKNYQLKILIRYRSILFFQLIFFGFVVFLSFVSKGLPFKIHSMVPILFFYFVTNDVFITLFDLESMELLKYWMFPTDFKETIFVKNIVSFFENTIYVTLLVLLCVLMFGLPFKIFFNAMTFYFVILFPLTTIGNLLVTTYSKINIPNYAPLRMFLSFAIVSILTVPYLAVKIILGHVAYCYPYILVTIVLWRYGSIPFVASQVPKSIHRIIESL